MLMNEFTQLPELDSKSLIDDLHFFMHNDPHFYRKEFFPMIAKVRDHIKSGKQCKDTVFTNCVKTAMDIYCAKYNINDKSVFTDVDRDELARQIFGQEVEHIHQGTYDN